MMSDFWSRKRDELQARGELPPPQRSELVSGPWWSDGTTLLQQSQITAPESSEPRTEPSDGLDGHDVSKAAHLRASSNCPRCNKTDFMKVSSSVAPRCFSCGYVEGR